MFKIYCMVLYGVCCCVVSASVVCPHVFRVFVHNCMTLYGLWFVRCGVIVGCCYLCVWFVRDLLCDVVWFLSKGVCVLCGMYRVMLSGVCLFVCFV